MASVHGDEAARPLQFDVEPGPRVAEVRVTFPGAHALSRGRLLAAAGGTAALLREPAAARERILVEYRKKHYLKAEVTAPAVAESEDHARLQIAVAVREGPWARLSAVRFQGTSDAGPDLDALEIDMGKQILEAGLDRDRARHQLPSP